MIASAIEHSNFQFLISMYCISFVKNSKVIKNMKKVCEEKNIQLESFFINLNKPSLIKEVEGSNP